MDYVKTVPIPENLDGRNVIERLISFYRQLGWNGISNINPDLVRITRDDAEEFINREMELENQKNKTSRASTGIFLMNFGPSNKGKNPGKVELWPGWIELNKQQKNFKEVMSDD